MTSTPTPPKHIRLTISVTPEVHATFQRMAKASGQSISRSMGGWLDDTCEAASFMAEKLEQARAAPKLVAQEMHAYAMGLADETGQLMEQLRERGRAERRSARAVPHPPSSNTGGKGHGTKGQGKGGRA